MNAFAQAVRSKLNDPSCVVDVVQKGSCDASLKDAPHPYVIIDLNASGAPLGPAQAKCDFLFFADPNLVMPIEIKDGAPNVTKARRQLQAGAKAAEQLSPRGLRIVCRPVLVSKELRRQKQFELRKARVLFRKNREKIVRLDCGAPLTEAVGTS